MTKSCGPWIGLLPRHVECRRKRLCDRMPAGCWAALIFLLLVTSRVRAQDIFNSSSVNSSPYQDEFSRNCEPSNSANPYAGMDPLSCHGVMAPTDSRNQCSLRGMTLLQKWGNTCYYCQPINPPINGIILPLDQIAKAGRQGYRCGVDQADPKCMAICTGGGQFRPPPPAQKQPAPSGCDPQMAAPPAGGALPRQTAINMMELWTQRIDTYWFKQFVGNNFPYRRPLLVLSNQPGALWYRRDNQTIEYNPATVSAIVQGSGPFGLVIALAHEEGHSVQHLRGSRLEGMPRELDADRLAGAYLRWAQDNHFLHQCDIGAAAMAIFQAGDTLPDFNPHHHGTPQQRVNALLQGYLHGPNPF
jgi:hypothetical protein